MTGPKGNRETLKGRGQQNSLFHVGPVIKCFVLPPYQKRNKLRKIYLLDAGWHANLPRFQEARHDHVEITWRSPATVQRSSCRFLRELGPVHTTLEQGTVSARDSGASSPGSNPGRGHCVVSLSETLYSYSASRHAGV